MNMYLKMAWRNVWRNRKRTWITASSIAFAVLFACVMQSMQLGSYERMIDNSVRFYTGHLAIHQQNYWDEKILDNAYQMNRVENIDFGNEIETIVPRLTSFALASNKDRTKGVMVNGIDPGKEAELTYLDEKIIAGTYYEDQGILVATGLAEYLKLNLNDTLVLISQGYHGVNAVGKYRVVGILKFPVPELNQSAVYMTLNDAQEFYGAPGLITSTSILAKDERDVSELKTSISNQLSGTDLRVMDWKKMMPELIQGIELDYYGGLIMIYILYAVIGFGILGTFLMMTKERTYEFGILSSIGMRKAKIQWVVAMEIVMLTFLGVVMGLTLGMPLILHFYYNPIVFTGELAAAYESFGYEAIMPFSLAPKVFYDQAIVVLIISLFLGLYPMLYIKHLKIIKALRE